MQNSSPNLIGYACPAQDFQCAVCGSPMEKRIAADGNPYVVCRNPACAQNGYPYTPPVVVMRRVPGIQAEV
jgi:hypothetical protein